MTQIKICGLKSIEDAQIVNEFNPEYVGFIFVKGRKRYIEPNEALEIRKRLNKNIKTVGVFWDEDIDIVASIDKMGIIDVVQLHGAEDSDYIERLRKKVDKPLIKAIRMDCREDIEKAKSCRADIVLLDCGAGGTGKTFDWSLIKNLDRDYFLAGGLNSDNVAGALENLKPYGVDVSSGVETEGRKDREKIKSFIDTVRKEGLKND